MRPDLRCQLQGIATLSDADLDNLKRRKLAEKTTRKSYKITRGENYRPVRVKKFADLTKEMLGLKTDLEEGTHW